MMEFFVGALVAPFFFSMLMERASSIGRWIVLGAVSLFAGPDRDALEESLSADFDAVNGQAWKLWWAIGIATSLSWRAVCRKLPRFEMPAMSHVTLHGYHDSTYIVHFEQGSAKRHLGFCANITRPEVYWSVRSMGFQINLLQAWVLASTIHASMNRGFVGDLDLSEKSRSKSRH